MNYTHEEAAKLLKQYIERKDELNGKAGAEIFDIQYVDYDDNDVFVVRCNI